MDQLLFDHTIFFYDTVQLVNVIPSTNTNTVCFRLSTGSWYNDEKTVKLKVTVFGCKIMYAKN